MSKANLHKSQRAMVLPGTVGQADSADMRRYRAWIEAVNPLKGLTATKAQAVYDAARAGNTVRLQWLYHEIESADPTLLICTERRSGALADLDWTVRRKGAGRGAKERDDKLAEEQEAYLAEFFGRLEDSNLWDGIEHLAAAFFRGFAHTAPVWSADGLYVERFEVLPQWLFCRDMTTGDWLWNPSGDGLLVDYQRLTRIYPEELCSVVRTKHVDYPALQIFLRSALGEKSWGRFIDRYGIPPVIIIMPPDIDPALVDKWREGAQQVAEGGSGALQHGSDVKYAEGGRGINPFSAFLDHQQQMVVLMATGGLFTSLTGATGIGQGASEAHQQTWRQIVRRDATMIAAAINRQMVDQALDRAFPGKAHLAMFDFETESKPTTDEIFDTARKAREAGFTVDTDELIERTGWTLTRAPEPPQHGYALMNREGAAPGAAPEAPGVAAAPDPLEAALAVIEGGGEIEAALDAYDAEARKALEPEAVAARAEPVAAALEAAVAATLTDATDALANANPNHKRADDANENDT